ncbi:MAG: Trp biosynthesis-associated membrane protein [Candidatus Microbacterium phytovorans]|uniref:Trp biosynthesis-associated membrane protein n=1 Tax=Candidatus Microbacterium phytovorans TaxID=3121374 RepID=A0AAJ5W302_9MICO|nr:Trp biosynthesis-associated membrane protein [Microbacterium sp.]WEK14303.1 MAG: Trp biosynthesis-associated membrane protein [Microbacterium sp.]
MTRRLRSLSVLTILVAAAVALIASTQTWLDVTLRGATNAPLAVAGAAAVPLLAPLSLAALALALALSIVGRVLRYVFGALAIAIGASLAVAAARILVEHPVDAVAGAVTEATGLAGAETVRALVAEIISTPWPLITVVASIALAAGGVATVVTAHRWPGAGRRYRTETADVGAGSRPHDAIDSWDDLSRGDDPTA